MRVRANLVSGSLSDAGLTSAPGAVTMNSAGLTSLPTVGGNDIAAITLDPQAVNGASEVIWVTVHTAGSTTATVMRAQEGSVQRSHPSGEAWSHDPTAADFTDVGPVGTLVMFAGTVAPTGWLLCQGQAVSRTGYGSLFAVLGTAYGVGDGSTTFNLPDLRTRFPIGASGTVALAATGGALGHTHAEGLHSHAGPSHSHTSPTGTHNHGNTGGTSANHSHAYNSGTSGSVLSGVQSADHGHTTADVNPGTGSTGLDGSESTSANAGTGTGGSDPPYVGLNYLVKW